MSGTPKKSISKRGRKPNEPSVNDNCRFCKCNFVVVGGSNASFENLFKASGRQGSKDVILAKECESIGLPLKRSPRISERVCRPCGRKIRNAVHFFNFVKQAVEYSNTQDESANESTSSASSPPLHSTTSNVPKSSERTKRMLPTTVTPERLYAKKVNVVVGDKEKKSSRRKSLFSEPEIEDEQSDETSNIVIVDETRVKTTTTSAVETTVPSALTDSDFLKQFYNVETIIGKETTQIKVVVAFPNRRIITCETFDELTKSIIKNLALKNWKTAANQFFKHPELLQSATDAIERNVSSEFSNISKSDTMLKEKRLRNLWRFQTNFSSTKLVFFVLFGLLA